MHCWNKEKEIGELKAKYIKKLKNDQVKEFYDKCGFKFVDGDESKKNYLLSLKDYKPRKIEYIEVING